MKLKRSVNLEDIWTKSMNQDSEMFNKTSPSYWAAALLSTHLNTRRDNNKIMSLSPNFDYVCKDDPKRLSFTSPFGCPAKSVSTFSATILNPLSPLAGATIGSVANKGSIGYICFHKEVPIIQIDSLSNYNIDNNKLEKISSMIIKEQIYFYKPYIKDIEILKVFESRLKLIKDNKLYLLKRTGEKNESNICKMY